MGDMDFAFIVITATALVYSVLSLHINRTIGNRKRVKEIQKEMNRISGLLKKADYQSEASRKEAEVEQEKIPKLMMESMMLQFKPLIITLPIFIVLSYVMKNFFAGFFIKIAFALPIFIQNLDRFPNWRDEFGPLGWFVLCLLFSGIIVQLVIERVEKK